MRDCTHRLRTGEVVWKKPGLPVVAAVENPARGG